MFQSTHAGLKTAKFSPLGPGTIVNLTQRSQAVVNGRRKKCFSETTHVGHLFRENGEYFLHSKPLRKDTTPRNLSNHVSILAHQKSQPPPPLWSTSSTRCWGPSATQHKFNHHPYHILYAHGLTGSEQLSIRSVALALLSDVL